ncbi:MAG: hypothetical protein H0W73_06315 [Bacteroidetes bacterium]|nr:hypothetical protein [Bacteroidota bacterium]
MWPFSDKLPDIYNNNGYDTDVLDYNDHEFFNYKKQNKKKYFNKIKGNGVFKIFRIIQNYLFPYYFKKQLQVLDEYYAIIVFYHSSFLNKYIDLLKAKTKKIVIIYAGSDFYRASNKDLMSNKLLLDACSKIVFTNPGMAKDLTNFYKNYAQKFSVNHFGLNIIDCLIQNKEKIKTIPSKAIRITIGYNGSDSQQHIKIIETIAKISMDKKYNLEFIFPFTYAGNAEYLNSLKNKIAQLNINAIFYEEKLSELGVAEMRANSDIVINMQVSDQASGSLVEYLATGNIMIVANWLPYSYWDDFKFYYHKVDFDNLSSTLAKILANYTSEKESSKVNIPIAINNFSSKSRLNEVLQILN